MYTYTYKESKQCFFFIRFSMCSAVNAKTRTTMDPVTVPGLKNNLPKLGFRYSSYSDWIKLSML